ncbi:MAG: Uma2 family endonuclease [Acidobacteriaceae bacterium]|nr:Uma2 family endonuclease [Acidobacteriaceae bacterium]MBV9766302.1 Uma2 family endonuclease [Acidobacteriaceae bacterium]
MATVTAPLSLEEFHRLYDDVKPYHEYWFGEAVPKSLPNSVHGALQGVLMMMLHWHGWRPAPEVTLKLVRDAEPIPDIVASREPLEQPYPTRPFELAVEIRSPSDLLKKLFTKAQYYLDWGIQNVWIIDPEARTAWVLTREHPEPTWIHPDSSLKIEDIEISLPEVFGELDKMVC